MLVKLLILLFLGSTGAGLVGIALHTLRLAHASRHWLVVPGVVTSSSVERWGLYGSNRVSCGVRVEYDYWVDDYRYVGRRRLFDIWRIGGVSLEEARRLEKEVYRPGTQVGVHVDPHEPSQSVIETRADEVAVASCLSVGLLFLSVEVILVLNLFGVVAV